VRHSDSRFSPSRRFLRVVIAAMIVAYLSLTLFHLQVRTDGGEINFGQGQVVWYQSAGTSPWSEVEIYNQCTWQFDAERYDGRSSPFELMQGVWLWGPSAQFAAFQDRGRWPGALAAVGVGLPRLSWNARAFCLVVPIGGLSIALGLATACLELLARGFASCRCTGCGNEGGTIPGTCCSKCSGGTAKSA
jgi:hypothetical protein